MNSNAQFADRHHCVLNRIINYELLNIIEQLGITNNKGANTEKMEEHKINSRLFLPKQQKFEILIKSSRKKPKRGFREKKMTRKL